MNNALITNKPSVDYITFIETISHAEKKYIDKYATKNFKYVTKAAKAKANTRMELKSATDKYLAAGGEIKRSA